MTPLLNPQETRMPACDGDSTPVLNALILYAHPDPTSFTAALRDRASAVLSRAGFAVTVSDLYGEGFHPVLDRHDFTEPSSTEKFHIQTEQEHAYQQQSYAPEIAREQARLAVADIFVPIFPLWWGGVPAIVKGWCDRVLSYGFAYADGQRFDKGYLRGRDALICVSTGGTRQRFSPEDVYGDMETVLHPLKRCTLEYLGFDVPSPFVAYASPRVSAEDRQAYLDTLEMRLIALADKARGHPNAGLRGEELRQRQQAYSGAKGWTRS